MDRKTIIAVVLSVVIIIGGMYLQNVLARKKQAALPQEKPPTAVEQPKPEATPAPQAAPAQAPQATQPAGEQPAPLSGQPAPTPAAAGQAIVGAAEPQLTEQTFTKETEVYRITFSNRGGVVTSIQLKAFKNWDGSRVEMVFSKNTGIYPFALQFGDASAPLVDTLFHFEQSAAGDEVSFYRTFVSPSGIPFELRKTFRFKPSDYVIEVRVAVKNSVNEYPDLKFGNFAYTIGFGPQIGPPFDDLKKANEIREYTFLTGAGKRDQAKRFSREGSAVLQSQVSWAAIVGKYFEVIAVPNATSTVTYVNKPVEGLPERSSIYISRPSIQSADTTKDPDVFRFYVGPNEPEILARYDNKDKNGFGLQGMRFEESATKGFFRFYWLANILKFFLVLFYKLIPNYGVAILLLTLFIKLLFWPLTNSSYKSMAKMQALQPKMKELQAKFKNNPQKLNQEMAALYKKEKVSPLGGCLPMLLQMPIFVALYTLLSSHFDLRGATFIAGWINDLSAPDLLFSFKPFRLPIMGIIDGLHLLPFLMLGTTILQSKVSQTSGPTDRNMALMTYAMPIFFFLILYNLPSGLNLYWTAQNVLSFVQQLFYNYRRGKKVEAEAVQAQASEPWKYPKRK